MNPEDNFLNQDNVNEREEALEILNDEPQIAEEYPNVGNYDRDALIQAIKEARE